MLGDFDMSLYTTGHIEYAGADPPAWMMVFLFVAFTFLITM